MARIVTNRAILVAITIFASLVTYLEYMNITNVRPFIKIGNEIPAITSVGTIHRSDNRNLVVTNDSTLSISESNHLLRSDSSNFTDIKSSSATKEIKLLSLFTTIKPAARNTQLFRNTLINWNNLAPDVSVILYAGENASIWEDEVRDFANWKVYPAPLVRRGLPVLRRMYLHAMNVSKATFYGYANGDLLFSTTLIDTLRYLRNAVASWKEVLITSRRTGLLVNSTQEIIDFVDVVELSYDGKLFMPNSEDLFITKVGSYPWESIPDFVVGRIGYDNWLVANALLRRIPVIDVTDTVLTLHQSDEFTGDRSSWSIKSGADRDHNKRLLGRKFFPYSLGSVECVPFRTKWDVNKLARLVPRQITDAGCLSLYKRYKLEPSIFHKIIFNPPRHSITN